MTFQLFKSFWALTLVVELTINLLDSSICSNPYGRLHSGDSKPRPPKSFLTPTGIVKQILDKALRLGTIVTNISLEISFVPDGHAP